MIGLLLGNALRGPLAMLAGCAAVVALCGICKCMKCGLRDCACMKKLLRFIGHDEFDDFELMILVHEATFESKAKMSSSVKVTAGRQNVQTDANSDGVFQQPLHIQVEQGTENVVVELLDSRSYVLAEMKLEIMGHILNEQNLQPEMVYSMKQKPRSQITKPKVKLTMVVSKGGDEETGLLAGMSSDVDILVRQQLAKAKQEGHHIGEGHEGEPLSEMEVLMQACAGPLELFEGLGKTHNVYVAVSGPPHSKRWILGIWNDKKEYDAKRTPKQEVELLKIETVQGDPTRHHVFVINCFDESRVRKQLTFRRIDRARDVWVEILHLLVTKARDAKKAMKTQASVRHPTHHGSDSGVARPSKSPRGRSKTFMG